MVRAVRRRPVRYTAAALVLLGAVAVPVALYIGDPDRLLHTLQRTIGRGEPFTSIGMNGEPVWSRWFVQQSASATLDREGYFTIDALVDGAMLELARDLPVASYRIAAKVRHNKSLPVERKIGMYVGGRSVDGTGATGRFFFSFAYNGVVDHGKAMPRLPNLIVPEGNAVTFAAALRVRRDHAPVWGCNFGGASNVRVKPPALAPDQWRHLEILVHSDAVQAFFDGAALDPLVLAQYHPLVQRDFTTALKGDAERRDFLHSLPPRFDPQGSLGLYVAESSASFTDFVVTPLTNAGADR